MENVGQTIISQYSNSPILVKLIQNFNAYVDPHANFEAFYNLIWNLQTAQGYGLDVWGRIVGVQRVLQVSSGVYFGFAEAGDGSEVPFNQAPFYSGGPTTGNFALTDESFRTLIYAKAFANISDGSILSINNILMTLFGVQGACYVTDLGTMAMTYTFTFTLTPVDFAIVSQSGVLPKPTGVTLTIVTLNGALQNNGGVLQLVNATGWPTSATGLAAGAAWDAGGAIYVVPGATPSPSAAPVFFNSITADELLALGGGNLPLTDPVNTLQIWNNAGILCVSLG